MSREKKTVRVPEFPGTRNRDLGKIFLIEEWPAARAEKWATMMLASAINHSGGEIPMSVSGMGMEGIAIIAINTIFLRGNIPASELIPLMDQLLECAKIIRDPKKPDVATDIIDDADIMEVATRLWLRGEVLSLHLNFSVGAALSALYSRIMTKPIPDSTDSLRPSTSPPE